MSLKTLPEIRADIRIDGAHFDVRPDAVERWQPEMRAATESDASISIYDTIGRGWDGEGITAKRIGAALRNIGAREVVVNINSPGGDFFEGVAIYNQLREHRAKVTVQVMGLAASAASVIAMAGDEILMGDGSFLMIHNAWAVAVGNRHDLADAAARLQPFDEAMANVYAARSGMSVKDAAALMDAETWIGAAKAVEDGFADAILERDAVGHEAAKAHGNRRALALVESSMAKAGLSRSTRREAVESLFASRPGATASPPSDSGDIAASLQLLINSLKR